MKRTLMQLGVGALEEMFEASKTDVKVLRQLESELTHRQVPRAVALLEQVQLAMKRLATSLIPRAQDELPLEPPAVLEPVSVQPPSSPERISPVVVVTTPVPQPGTPSASQQARPPAADPAIAPQARVERTPTPPVSLDDACKLLNVTLATPWKEVELVRRKLVLLSHPRHVVGMPKERLEAVRMEARRVNAAYAALSAARVK
jgi:hypothetical protein